MPLLCICGKGFGMWIRVRVTKYILYICVDVFEWVITMYRTFIMSRRSWSQKLRPLCERLHEPQMYYKQHACACYMCGREHTRTLGCRMRCGEIFTSTHHNMLVLTSAYTQHCRSLGNIGRRSTWVVHTRTCRIHENENIQAHGVSVRWHAMCVARAVRTECSRLNYNSACTTPIIALWIFQ